MQVNSVISVFVCLVFEYLTDILVVERVSVLSDFLDTGVKGGEERESSAELRGRQSLSPCNNVLSMGKGGSLWNADICWHGGGVWPSAETRVSEIWFLTTCSSTITDITRIFFYMNLYENLRLTKRRAPRFSAINWLTNLKFHKIIVQKLPKINLWTNISHNCG